MLALGVGMVVHVSLRACSGLLNRPELAGLRHGGVKDRIGHRYTSRLEARSRPVIYCVLVCGNYSTPAHGCQQRLWLRCYTRSIGLAAHRAGLINGRDGSLSHIQKDKDSLLSRTRRIRGQVEAVERALEDGDECASILQQIAACRGAINGLMGELMEGELRDHVLSPNAKPGSDRARAAERLIQVLRTYLK